MEHYGIARVSRTISANSQEILSVLPGISP
jgi:hypothetical protein